MFSPATRDPLVKSSPGHLNARFVSQRRQYVERLTHSGLSWHTSGDNDNISTSQGLLETIIRGEVSLDLCGGGDVGQVRSDTRGVDDIEETELNATTAPSALASSIPLYVYAVRNVGRVYIPRRREGWSSRAEPEAGQYHLQIVPPLISTQIYPLIRHRRVFTCSTEYDNLDHRECDMREEEVGAGLRLG